jgi:hypothetical protein
MLVLYAHRDNTGGRVVSSLWVQRRTFTPFINQSISLEVHHEDDVENFSHKNLNADVTGFHLAFETWADKVLPQGKASNVTAR